MKKVVLVTGAARGIGKVIAGDFARDHDVAITWLTTEPVALPENVLPIRADLTETDAAEQIVARIIERFGRLDLIINNAGNVTDSALDRFDAAALSRMIHVNLLAAEALLVAALPHMGAGSGIISISSANATFPPRGAALYGASKAALNLWTKGMAKELGPRGIRVNAVSPGAVDDPDNPRPQALVKLFADETALGRIASPQDIADAVRFLASDKASFITGEIITVSGGYRL